MVDPIDSSGARLDDTSLVFDRADGSVFDSTPFIDDAELAPALAAPIVPPPDQTPDRTWQSAAGGRLLTPPEQAARERYFDAKAAASIERVRRGQRPSAA